MGHCLVLTFLYREYLFSREKKTEIKYLLALYYITTIIAEFSIRHAWKPYQT